MNYGDDKQVLGDNEMTDFDGIDRFFACESFAMRALLLQCVPLQCHMCLPFTCARPFIPVHASFLPVLVPSLLCVPSFHPCTPCLSCACPLFICLCPTISSSRLRLLPFSSHACLPLTRVRPLPSVHALFSFVHASLFHPYTLPPTCAYLPLTCALFFFSPKQLPSAVRTLPSSICALL
jgi:hypothetical protein